MNNNSLELLSKRDLDKSYFVLYIMPNPIYYKEASNYVNVKNAYILFGCNLEGKRKYITTVLETEVSKTSDWYNYFQEFKKRKLEYIIFCLMPDIKELKEAIKLAYPEVEIFMSYDKTLDKLKKYKTYKTKDAIFDEIKKLYLARDLVEYELNYQNFIDRYSGLPFIMDMLDDDLKKLKSTYKYSLSVRKVIYSFNFVYELKKRVSIFTHDKTFCNKYEFTKYIVKYVHNTEKQCHFIRDDWSLVLNDVYEEKKDMIKPFL